MTYRALAVVASLAVLSLSAACSSGTDVKPSSEKKTVATAKSDTPSNGDIQKYFDSLASNEPEQLTAAIKLAAPNSIAAAYAQYQLDASNAAIDGGGPLSAEKLTKIKGGFKDCASDETGADSCVNWTDLQSTDGKLSNLKVNDIDITDRISVGDGSKENAGELATVQFLTAYQSVQANSMIINLEIKSKDQKISIGAFNATYRDADGRQTKASGSDGPTDLDADSTANVQATFDHAKPGGILTLTISDEDFNTTKDVKIKTR